MATAVLKYDYTFTLFIVGDNRVGKATFMKQLHEAEDDDGHNIGSDTVVSKQLDAKLIKIKIWKVGLNDSVNALGYKEANGVIVMYDVTNAKSFENVELIWAEQIEKLASPQVAVMVVGNKCDCEPSNVAVTTEAGQRFANKYGYQFMEISSECKTNVTQAIDRLTRIMIGPLPRIKKSG